VTHNIVNEAVEDSKFCLESKAPKVLYCKQISWDSIAQIAAVF
jgi:hypothetical protein